MKPRLARWIAWSLVGAFIILAAVGVRLQVAADSPYIGAAQPVVVILVILAGVWIVTGALIVSRHPMHPVGWLLCAGLFTPALDMFSAGYAAYDTYEVPGSLPGVLLAHVWLKLEYLGALGLTAFILVILFFPTGRLPSPRWRWVVWAAIGSLLFYLPLQIVEPGPVDPTFLPTQINPLGVDLSLWGYLRPLMWGAFTVLMSCYLAALISQVSRLRRARGDERQQVKWLIFPASMYWISILIYYLTLTRISEPINGISLLVAQAAVAGILIAIAFSIFKYRLYDIDRIINHTLVYGALTGALGVIYFMSVVLLQQVFPSESSVSIVLSTLAIAALFTPLRGRIQKTIDKRFYRSKYDAQKTLDSFSAKIRDEVELERHIEMLLSVVEESLQPEHASLWLQRNDKNAYRS